MDVPSSAAGVVKSVAVKKGDRVSKGSAIVEVEGQQQQAAEPTEAAGSAKRQLRRLRSR